MTEGVLIPSSNRGRYAVKDAPEGPYIDLTSGDMCEALLGRQWIIGVIEHSAEMYADPDLPYKAHRGYYFLAHDGSVCGLCMGMRVRVP